MDLRGFQRFYKNLFIETRLGHAYLTKDGSKGFAPLGKVPKWKCNAIQVIPGNWLLVVDVDNREGYDGHKNLPCPIPADIPTVETQSGGRHYWFKGDSRLHTHADCQTRIDVLTGSTGIFAPPSKVQGGGEYRWLVPLTHENLRPLPEELFEFLLKLQEPKAAHVQTGKPFIPGSKGLYDISPKQKAYLDMALDRCRTASKGSRSEADFCFIIWGLSCGLDEGTLWGLCCDIGKFKERGMGYFRFTVKNAMRRIHS